MEVKEDRSWSSLIILHLLSSVQQNWTTVPLHYTPYWNNSLLWKLVLPSSSTSGYTLKSCLHYFSWVLKEATKCLLFRSNPEQLTLWWGVVVGVRVAPTAVLHQETGIVPGHADDAIRLMQQNMGQHAPMAVHHYHLSICSTKQHLEWNSEGLLGRWKTKTWQKCNTKTTEQR